jgi:hypothetical protein
LLSLSWRAAWSAKAELSDLVFIAFLVFVSALCVGVFLLPASSQNALKADRSVFNPITYVTASFVHGNVVHLGSDLSVFILFAILLYVINRSVHHQRFFFLSVLIIFTALPVIDYGTQWYYGIFKSVKTGFGLSLVDSGLIGLALPSLILFFKTRVEKFNSLIFFLSYFLSGLCLVALPYSRSSQFWLFLIVFAIGLAVGNVEYRRIFDWLANLRIPTSERKKTFFSLCAVLFTMVLYFIFIIGLFPSSIIQQGAPTDIVSHFIGLLFGSLVFSFYAIINKPRDNVA